MEDTRFAFDTAQHQLIENVYHANPINLYIIIFCDIILPCCSVWSVTLILCEVITRSAPSLDEVQASDQRITLSFS